MLSLLSKEEFDDVFSIMEESFPCDEYRNYEEQKALLSLSEYSIYTTCEKGSASPKAFAAVYEFNDFVFIEHLAVSSEYRNLGLGGTVLRELKNKFKKIICLEVEPPITDIAKRRIGFYERNGYFFNSYDYIQPPISKGKQPVRLYIMSYGRKIGKTEFQEIKNTLYTKVYGERS